MLFKKTEKQITEYQNELIEKHCGEVENIYRQMRGWRHDFHNHIQAIKACIAMGETDKLLAFCDKLDSDLRDIDCIVKSGNVMLDAILNSKLSLAKAKSISVSVKAAVPQNICMEDIDLCVLLGNLLDNAIEACESSGAEKYEFEGAFIRVYIGTKGNQLYICVTNSAYGEVKKIGGRFLSQKGSELHGFGLMRVDKVCKKYSGYCRRGAEPGVFSTEILIPLSI